MRKLSNPYSSVYGAHIKAFIDVKRKLGFKFKTGAVILSLFDRLAFKRREACQGITRQLADSWSRKMPNESELYRYDRVRHLAQFSMYLNDLGIQSYVPKLPPYPSSTFIPYVYSQKQIEAIFKASDELRLELALMKSSLISVPALLRLLYATGIRINEALNLQDEDVNLKESYLRVKDLKNGKQRLIPISPTLVRVLKEHESYKSRLPLAKKTGYFFVNLSGKKCGYGSVTHWFKECLHKAGIKCGGRMGLPRVHDLRHTFAVSSLASMAEAGVDLYASLPILSAYLGHQSLGATNHYVRLTSNMYPDLIRDVDMICLDVFPKLNCYEAD